MARINVEDKINEDVRFQELLFKVQDIDKAYGIAVRAWRLGAKFYLNLDCNRMIPISEWKKQKINDLMIEVGLATIQGDFVRITGADEHYDWILKKQMAGQKSAEKRKAQKEGKNAENVLDSVEQQSTGVEQSSTSFLLSPFSYLNTHNSELNSPEEVGGSPVKTVATPSTFNAKTLDDVLIISPSRSNFFSKISIHDFLIMLGFMPPTAMS